MSVTAARYENEAGGKNDWMQTGEMVKLGDAWRLVEGPSQGASSADPSPAPAGGNTAAAVSGNLKLQKKLEELTKLDVLPLGPVQGTALVPFVHDDKPAWYVFDLFDGQPIHSWLYQSDPDETRRKLTTAQMT